MLQINCPWCGKRDETEYCCGGESHITRPANPAEVSDAEWADYQFNRINPKGVHLERWCHTHGCRQWFNVARDTVTHEILAVYKMGEPAPQLDKGAQLSEDAKQHEPEPASNALSPSGEMPQLMREGQL